MKRVVIISLLFHFPAFAGWEVQFENTTYGFYGVDFVDKLHGWVVGGNDELGVILKTKDGGINWDWTYTDYCLHGVEFVDSLCGWIVGDSGVIMHTEDGGTSWSIQTSGTTLPLSWVTFLDKDEGWTTGGTVTSSAIFHTVNGGSTWVQQADVGGRQLSFVDSLHGWASGDRVWSTSNGGETWEIQETGIPDSLIQAYAGIFFVDTLNGCAGFSYVTNPSHDHIGLIHTKDGGSTWMLDTTVGGASYIYFLDPYEGWRDFCYSVIVFGIQPMRELHGLIRILPGLLI